MIWWGACHTVLVGRVYVANKEPVWSQSVWGPRANVIDMTCLKQQNIYFSFFWRLKFKIKVSADPMSSKNPLPAFVSDRHLTVSLRQDRASSSHVLSWRSLTPFMGNSQWLSVEFACQYRRHRFNLWVRKIPEIRNGKMLQYSY